MEKKLDAVCVGAAIVDIPLQPVNRDMFEIESFPLQQISMTIGGDAINEATIMSRLGHRIGLMSMVGRDAVGNFIIEHCEKNGIDYSGIKVREGIDTSINVGLVTADGERTFVTNRNGSLWKMTIDDVDLSRLKEARLLSLASIFNNPLLDCQALVKIFQEAKAQDMIICADMIKARLGEKIVILGAGCIGLMTLQGCKSLGATDIVVVDVMPKRLEMAKELGASAVINGMEEDTISRCKELVGELGADIVFETAGSQITAKQAPQIVARGGRIMIVGTIPGEVPIDFLKINREVTIQTVFRYANNYPMTIDAIASGKFDVKSMVTHVYDYQDVQKAFEESVHCKKDIIKGVIKIEDAE